MGMDARSMLEALGRELKRQHQLQMQLVDMLCAHVSQSVMESSGKGQLEVMEDALATSPDGMTAAELASTCGLRIDVVRSMLCQYRGKRFESESIGAQKLRWRKKSGTAGRRRSEKMNPVSAGLA